MIRESLLTEVEFRLKPGICEGPRHTDHLEFVSLVPEFRNHLGYVKEEREVSRIKMSTANLSVDRNGVPKNTKINQSPSNPSSAPGQNKRAH